MDFNALKKNRGAALKALQNELDETGGKKKDGWKDKRFWEPTVDKIGNGGAIIRFLPPKTGGDPFVKLWSHGFRGPTGQWYFENSRTTLGEPDPVAEYNSKLWNSGNEQKARDQKRRLHFISNILVVKDPGDPSNEGKVFMYKYGKKIFEKIEQALNPPFDDEGRAPDHDDYNPTNSVDPFDMWEGANFRLLIRKVDGFRNYDLSKFDSPKAVGSDEEMEGVWKQTYDISELVSTSNFKSYDELKDRLYKVLALDEDADGPKTTRKSAADMDTDASENVSEGDFDDDDEELDELEKLMKELG